jgi:S1-C subfamily serine protease
LAERSDWTIPAAHQPKTGDYEFDLETALSAVVGLSATIPSNAFTADVLGTERAGNGVVIEPGLVLTIGYLITEAETVWLTRADGRVAQGHALGYDQTTGFGLVQALGALDVPPLALGSSAELGLGDPLIVAGVGGRRRSVAGQLVALQPYAGYWEYLLEEALFIGPAHPQWGGAAVIDGNGTLVGIGSLRLEAAKPQGGAEPVNMAVPIDLLPPILDDLKRFGRSRRPPRPWIGVYATEVDDQVVIMGTVESGPAATAGVRGEDVVIAVGDTEIADLAEFYRAVWACGQAGAEVPLEIGRDGRTTRVVVRSVDRAGLLRAPRLH